MLVPSTIAWVASNMMMQQPHQPILQASVKAHHDQGRCCAISHSMKSATTLIKAEMNPAKGASKIVRSGLGEEGKAEKRLASDDTLQSMSLYTAQIGVVVILWCTEIVSMFGTINTAPQKQ